MLFFLFFILEVAHSDDTQQEVIKRVKVSFTSMLFLVPVSDFVLIFLQSV